MEKERKEKFIYDMNQRLNCIFNEFREINTVDSKYSNGQIQFARQIKGIPSFF